MSTISSLDHTQNDREGEQGHEPSQRCKRANVVGNLPKVTNVYTAQNEHTFPIDLALNPRLPSRQCLEHFAPVKQRAKPAKVAWIRSGVASE